MADLHLVDNKPVSVFDRLYPLTSYSKSQLDAAFAEGTAESLPQGKTTGICLPMAGTWLGTPLARLYWLAWKGKIFDRQTNEVVNRISLTDRKAIRTQAEIGPSCIDEAPCIVIDYSGLGRVGAMVRDEIRQIEPGLYLGHMFVRGRSRLKFALAETGET